MSNQIATVGDKTIATYTQNEDEYVDGSLGLGRGDLSVPRAILVQAQHADLPDGKKHVGEWYFTLTSEYRASVNAVLLGIGQGRTAFPRQFSRNSEPLCGSADGLAPDPKYADRVLVDPLLIPQGEHVGATCAECPFSKFGPNGETPLCAKAFNYFMLDADTGMPFVLRAQRSGMAAARNLNTVAKLIGRRRLVVIGSKEVKSETGSYYEPVFQTGDPTPEDTKTIAANLVREFGNMAQRAEPDGDGGRATTEPIFEDEPPL